MAEKLYEYILDDKYSKKDIKLLCCNSFEVITLYNNWLVAAKRS